MDIWVPRSAFVTLAHFPAERIWSPRSTLNQDFVIRPGPGVEPEAVEARIDAILAGLSESDADHREVLEGVRAEVHPGVHAEPVVRRVLGPAVGILAVAALLVLLIPCTNVANVLLSRAIRFRGVIAIQRAMGASSFRIARERLIESLLLGGVGALVGLAVATGIGLLVRGESLMGLPAFEGLVFDERIAVVTISCALVTTVLFGTLPAVFTARIDPARTLTESATQITGRHTVLRRGFSVVQIALSLSLLVGGLMLVRTVRNLYGVDTGVSVQGVSVVALDLGRDRPSGSALDALHRELLAAVEEVPGVQRAALHSWYGPFNGQERGRIAATDEADPLDVALQWVSPGWFELFEVDLERGRAFQPPDWRATDAKVMLTASLADRLFGGADPSGRSVWVGERRDLTRAEVVGVVEDVRLSRIDGPPDEAMFVSHPSVGAFENIVAILTRTSNDPGVVDGVRRAVEGVVPDLPVPEPAPLTDRIERQLSEQRLLAELLGLLSLLALPVAAVGLYGVTAFSVADRKREFGIRLALGADGRRIAGLVARSAGVVLLLGIALGLVGAHALSRIIEDRLFGVPTVDPASYAGAVALLLVATIVASWAPARAAVAVDPVTTLKSD